MSLSDALTKLHKEPTSRRSCLVADTFKQLDEPDGKALQEVLDNSAISNARISSTLKSAGIIVGESTINKHRKGGCCCGAQ